MRIFLEFAIDRVLHWFKVAEAVFAPNTTLEWSDTEDRKNVYVATLLNDISTKHRFQVFLKSQLTNDLLILIKKSHSRKLSWVVHRFSSQVET